MFIIKKLKVLFIILLMVAILAMGLSYYVKETFNSEKYKNTLEAQLSDYLSAKVRIKGLIELKYPNILVNNVEIIDIENSYKTIGILDNVTINYDFFAWIKKFPQLNKIQLKTGEMSLPHLLNQLKKKSPSNTIEVSNLTLKDFFLLDRVEVEQGILYIKTTELLFKGSLVGKESRKKYNSSINYKTDSEDFLITLKSDIASLNAQSSKEKGTLTVEGESLPNLLNDFTSIAYVKSNTKEPFKFSSTLIKSNFTYRLEGINFVSEMFKAQGKWHYEKDNWESSIQISDLNLDKVNYNKESLTFLSCIKGLENLINSFNLPNIHTNLSININNFTVYKQPKSKAFLQITRNVDKFANIYLEGLIGSDLSFKVQSIKGEDKYKPFCLGDLKIKGRSNKDFVNLLNITNLETLDIESKFYLAPQMASLNELKAQVNNTNVLGDLAVQKHGEIFTLKLNSSVNDLELSNYKYVNNLLQLITNSKIKSYLDLQLYNTKYKKKLFPKLEILINSLEGKVFFKNLSVDSKDIKLTGQLEYRPMALNSFLTGTINGKHLNVDSLELPQILKIERDKKANLTYSIWDSEPFNFSFLQNYSGILNVKFEEVKWGSETFKEAELGATLKNNVLNLHKLKLKKDKKQFNANGTLGVEENNPIKFSFSFIDFDLLPIFKNILKINAVKGRYSCVGSVNTQGYNIKDFLHNMNGQMEIATRVLNIDGINFKSLRQKLPHLTNKREIENLTKVEFFEGSTKFTVLDGKLNIANGGGAASLHFNTEETSGLIAANFILDNFRINTIAQIFFTVPKWNNSTISVEMNIENDIWNPRIFFDSNKILALIQKVDESTKSTPVQ